MLTCWCLAGASLDRSEEGGEETEAEAGEAAAAIVADLPYCRRCWEYFAAVTALALAWPDDAAERGIWDGPTALRAERRSIVKRES